MKKIAGIIVGILFLSCYGASGITNSVDIKTKFIENDYFDYSYFVDDISTQKILELSYSKAHDLTQISSENIIGKSDRDWEIGETIWQYTLTIYDPSPKAIKSIEDINNDGIEDVIVCSEDDHVRCFDGGAVGQGVILWEHEIYAGDVYSQPGLDIIEDVDDDGYEDVVVGATGGARLIRCISGKDGDTIWTHDTHEYGDGGWVYQVNSSFDFNDDGLSDVLATCGDDSSDTGPKRVYCLDGEDGSSIWEYPFDGPGFSVIGVEDFTGDNHPDVIAGASNNAETQGYAYGINGDTGGNEWTYSVSGSSVWALEQINDITNDGIKDVIVGDFYGNIYGLDATSGDVEYSNSVGSYVIIKYFAKLNDINSDGHPDLVPAHLGSGGSVGVKMIDGATGDFIWSLPVVDKPAVAARTRDISGDGLDDVLVGTLFSTNYCYYLNGVNGNELHSMNHGQAVDAIAAIPDVTADGSMEMMAGGRDGKLTCYSGGLDALVNDPPAAPDIDGPSEGALGVDYEFTFVTTEPDEENVYYYIEWGDGNIEDWIGPYESDEEVKISHAWSSADTFDIRAKAKDELDKESGWSIHSITLVENSAPSTPEIDGNPNGDVGKFYSYTFMSTDPDGNDVSYFIKWGDDQTTDWTIPQASGTPRSEAHKWTTVGTFNIEAKARDKYGAESAWGSFEVEMPRNRFVKHRFLDLFKDFFIRLHILNKLIFQ